MSEPRLVLVESFDELKIGQAVWVKLDCCGKLGGRYVVVSFDPRGQAVYEDLRSVWTPMFKFEPRHVCKVAFYHAPALLPKKFPVGASLITPEEVHRKLVYVEVVDLREREEEREKVPARDRA